MYLSPIAPPQTHSQRKLSSLEVRALTKRLHDDPVRRIREQRAEIKQTPPPSMHTRRLTAEQEHDLIQRLYYKPLAGKQGSLPLPRRPQGAAAPCESPSSSVPSLPTSSSSGSLVSVLSHSTHNVAPLVVDSPIGEPNQSSLHSDHSSSPVSSDSDGIGVGTMNPLSSGETVSTAHVHTEVHTEISVVAPQPNLDTLFGVNPSLHSQRIGTHSHCDHDHCDSSAPHADNHHHHLHHHHHHIGFHNGHSHIHPHTHGYDHTHHTHNAHHAHHTHGRKHRHSHAASQHHSNTTMPCLCGRSAGAIAPPPSGSSSGSSSDSTPPSQSDPHASTHPDHRSHSHTDSPDAHNHSPVEHALEQIHSGIADPSILGTIGSGAFFALRVGVDVVLIRRLMLLNHSDIHPVSNEQHDIVRQFHQDLNTIRSQNIANVWHQLLVMAPAFYAAAGTSFVGQCMAWAGTAGAGVGIGLGSLLYPVLGGFFFLDGLAGLVKSCSFWREKPEELSESVQVHTEAIRQLNQYFNKELWVDRFNSSCQVIGGAMSLAGLAFPPILMAGIGVIMLPFAIKTAYAIGQSFWAGDHHVHLKPTEILNRDFQVLTQQRLLEWEQAADTLSFQLSTCNNVDAIANELKTFMIAKEAAVIREIESKLLLLPDTDPSVAPHRLSLEKDLKTAQGRKAAFENATLDGEGDQSLKTVLYREGMLHKLVLSRHGKRGWLKRLFTKPVYRDYVEDVPRQEDPNRKGFKGWLRHVFCPRPQRIKTGSENTDALWDILKNDLSKLRTRTDKRMGEFKKETCRATTEAIVKHDKLRRSKPGFFQRFCGLFKRNRSA